MWLLQELMKVAVDGIDGGGHQCKSVGPNGAPQARNHNASRPSASYLLVKYSLRLELLVVEMDVSRCILVLDTSISETSNSERRE